MTAIFILSLLSSFALGAVSPTLGAAEAYGALGMATVTNTGGTNIQGNLGTGGSSITGFPPGNITGSLTYSNNTSAALADAKTAYAAVIGLTGAVTLTGDLGGRTLAPGTYKYPTSAGITGTLYLNSTFPSDAWYFQIGSTLTTAVGSKVILSDLAIARNVFWQVGSSATIGGSTEFAGTVLAAASVTLGTGAKIHGGVFGLGGDVTLDSNTILVMNYAKSAVYRIARHF